MPLFCEYRNCGSVVAVWKISESFDELARLLGNDSLRLYAEEHFSSVSRRCEWMAVRLLLLQMLGDGAAIEYDSSGRPYVSGGPEISVSHTKNYAVLAVSEGAPLGVDIEMRNRSTEGVRQRYMSARELNSMDVAGVADVSLIHWSVKEALYKVVGNLGGNFKDNIYVEPFELSEHGELFLSITGLGKFDARYRAVYYLENDFILTLCLLQ